MLSIIDYEYGQQSFDFYIPDITDPNCHIQRREGRGSGRRRVGLPEGSHWFSKRIMEPVTLMIIKFARERPPKILEGEWDRQGGLNGFLNHMGGKI